MARTKLVAKPRGQLGILVGGVFSCTALEQGFHCLGLDEEEVGARCREPKGQGVDDSLAGRRPHRSPVQRPQQHR